MSRHKIKGRFFLCVLYLMSMNLEPDERVIRDRIAHLEDGQTEVPTPAGRIDVLTMREVIEVKRVRQWKDAIGQVLAYAMHYPEHTPRVHLYGYAPLETYALAFKTMDHCHVRLTTEPDMLASTVNQKRLNQEHEGAIPNYGTLLAFNFLKEIATHKDNLELWSVADHIWVTTEGITAKIHLWGDCNSLDAKRVIGTKTVGSLLGKILGKRTKVGNHKIGCGSCDENRAWAYLMDHQKILDYNILQPGVDSDQNTD